MRNSFYEYYGLSQKEFDKLWKDAIVVFDTNVLLSLYRLPLEARNEILAVMKEFKNRLWMPFQVGCEFHEHRLEEANRPIDSLRSLVDRFCKFSSDLDKDYSRNPYIGNYKYLKDSLKSLQGKIERKTKEWLEDCPDMMHDDKVLSELSSLYEGKVGKSYDEAQLLEIYTKGAKRYSDNVPPGYKDKNKGTGDRHIYGDLIIWLQILDKAKESKCDIIFVTDDEKEDWWEIYKGNIIGPRRELITEFRTHTNNHIVGFYTTERFLSYAKKKIGVTVNKKTIEGVRLSDLTKDYLSSILGESARPGQFSIGSLYSSPFGRLGESTPNTLVSDSIGSLISAASALPTEPLGLASSFTSSPLESFTGLTETLGYPDSLFSTLSSKKDDDMNNNKGGDESSINSNIQNK